MGQYLDIWGEESEEGEVWGAERPRSHPLEQPFYPELISDTWRTIIIAGGLQATLGDWQSFVKDKEMFNIFTCLKKNRPTDPIESYSL